MSEIYWIALKTCKAREENPDKFRKNKSFFNIAISTVFLNIIYWESETGPKVQKGMKFTKKIFSGKVNTTVSFFIPK